MKAKPKSYLLRARVPKEIKTAVQDYAGEHGESEAVIVREALAEYFQRHKIDIGKRPLSGRQR